ncbi:hypothetical protein GQ53DRAFT_200907 [Thozetella sp. PMI_491]|nr:hypothetical protein GQ53DRAFT_200907 [Thozetella sp. PMI_491]
MAMTGADEQYFVYENRLASFKGPQPITKKRASNASSRAPRALHWPHKTLAPADLARAGFVFEPLQDNPDNVVCFLCQKALDGWEEDDNPLDEHLKHSPNCGWAITVAIEIEFGDYGKIHPLDPSMIEARKATFAGKWPYESKKGFKCKTKQLVEAGWKYTPTLESDDMATCTYCQLALDGWESGDKPIDEHYKRSPNCPFFALLSQNPKKGARAKAARGSKASRLSSQSVATVASDLGSVADTTANPDDSVLTTTSVMSKKSTRGKKTQTSKAKKTRTKKDEPVEILEDRVDDFEERPPPPPPKPAKGRKRASDEMDEPEADAVAPATKKRAVKGNNTDTSVLTIASQDIPMSDAIPTAKQPAGKKNARTRKASQASVRSQASTASLRAKATEDDELEHQLQADLAASLTDDENLAVDSDSERKRPPAKGRPRKGTTTRKASAQKQKEQPDDFAMFDPAPIEHDDAAVEADLRALEAEVETESQGLEKLEVPKKGRKAGTRKASKQTKKTKEPSPEPIDEPMADAVPAPEPEPVQQQDATEPEPFEDPDASTATVVNKSAPRESTGKRGRGRPPKKSNTSQPRSSQGAEEYSRLEPEVPANTKLVVEIKSTSMRESFSASKRTSGKVVQPVPAISTLSPSASTPRVNKALPPPPESEAVAPTPATPKAHATPSAKQAAISPSQSPQSSDAENQPPSSKPAASVTTKRVVLAPVAATPVRGSPSRKNVVAGLRSTAPWTAADLDLVFSPGSGKENGIDRLLRTGPDLTSPEKRMSVEEWIFHNASQAEQKLKQECEAMVSAFEKEGSRAMAALEGLIVE